MIVIKTNKGYFDEWEGSFTNDIIEARLYEDEEIREVNNIIQNASKIYPDISFKAENIYFDEEFNII